MSSISFCVNLLSNSVSTMLTKFNDGRISSTHPGLPTLMITELSLAVYMVPIYSLPISCHCKMRSAINIKSNAVCGALIKTDPKIFFVHETFFAHAERGVLRQWLTQLQMNTREVMQPKVSVVRAGHEKTADNYPWKWRKLVTKTTPRWIVLH